MADAKHGGENSALAQKIRNLLRQKEGRHKELKKIQEMLQEEDEQIKTELEKTVREIREEEEENFRGNQSEVFRETSANLEKTVEEEHPERAPGTGQFGYSTIDSSALQGTDIGIYDIAKQEVYDKVKYILDTPAQFRTSDERNFMKGITYQIDRVQRKEMYITEKDPEEFIKRTQSMISSFYK